MRQCIRYCTICILLPLPVPLHSQQTLYIIRNMLPKTGTGLVRYVGIGIGISILCNASMPIRVRHELLVNDEYETRHTK